MTVARPRAATVAYQGAPGAYGEAAIARHWNGTAEPVPVRTFEALVDAVATGRSAFGVVPLWNSTIGDIADACEALAAGAAGVEQVGDVVVPVRHALLALPGASVDTLRAVGSHPAALAQCGAWLRAHAAVAPVRAWDTAGAARELAALAGAGDVDGSREPWYAGVHDGDPCSLAVLANRDVAASCGLTVLVDGVQDAPDNATRFAVIAPRRGAARW